MHRLYVGTVLMVRQVGNDRNTTVNTFATFAVNDAEALGQMVKESSEKYPCAEGWAMTFSQAAPIADSYIREAYQNLMQA